jgi:simple sugar transport system substrate-binding protein
MKRKALWFVGLIAALMLALAPFNSTLAQSYEPENPEFYFHIIYHTSPHPFWYTMVKGAMDAAKRYNVKMVSEMFPRESHEDQANRIDQVIALKPDGIVTAITTTSLIEAPIRRAIKAGIPVIAGNAQDYREGKDKIPYLFFVGADEIQTGKLLAEEMLKHGTPKHILITNHKPGLIVLEKRIVGFKSVMEPLGIKISIQKTSHNPTEILEQYRSWWAANPDTDGYWSMNPQPWQKIAQEFFEEEGLTGKVLNVATDMSVDSLDALKNGKLICMTDQQIYLQGYLTIHWFYLYKKYGFLPGADIATGPLLITKDNVDIVKAGLKGGWRY